MGAVYLAEHVRMLKPVAVKVLHKEMGRLAEAVFRFEREAVASGRVDHEHLVTATDFGELPDGSMYLVLEYVPGRSLAAVMADGPMPAIRVLHIARQIAAALAAIHGVGIVHRDLKPDNIMLVERSGTPDFVKLLDFGMAKVTMDVPPEERQVTRMGLVFGTPRYMAPEQAAGEPTDHRADLYALGILVYAMLSGAPPFSGEEIREILRAQRFDPPPPLPDDVDPAVAGFVMTLLAKDPKERVQTAALCMEYIDRLVERLLAPKPTAKFHFNAFLQTRPGIAVLSGVALLVFVAAFAGVRALRARPATVVVIPPTSVAPSASVNAAPIGAMDPELEAQLVRAEVGDPTAWLALESRPDATRGAREWFVLGVARITHGQMPKGLDAYLRASEADRKYADHPRVLRDLMLGVRSTEAWEPALRVAAALPSPAGADILFDVWAGTPKATPATQRARELLASDAVRGRASDAVRVAFDLRTAQGMACEARMPVVTRAAQVGDARAFRPLAILAVRSGCGPREKDDCFPCLRKNDALERALARAKETPAPDYTRISAAK
jgi:serine/threonine-protein kinase